ncbi:MAG: LPS export ABC transporter periplasmic protein LptC [Sideroxydans sp.]|nr:LPS export ABC transporter periplasmic protein LptC [Sideroxydans sp.]
MEHRSIFNTLRSWLPLLPFVLLLGASYWLSLQVQPLPTLDKTVRHELDYTIDKLSSTTLNEMGTPHFTLSAERLWHYPDDDSTHLSLPNLNYFTIDRPQIHASAKLGTLSNKAEHLFLQDNVQLTMTSDKLERSFTTEYLHIIPEREWAETDRAVTLQNGRSTISAIGMEIDNPAHTLKLLSQVRAEHEPTRK